MSLSATAQSSNIVYIGVMNKTEKKATTIQSGGVAAVVPFDQLAEHGVNKTPQTDQGLTTMPAPGDNVKKRRQDAGLSMRALAEKCNPAIDHTTVRRVEMNLGFTQDTLERIAVALGCDFTDFFLPDELQGWAELPLEDRTQIANMVQNAALAARYKKAGGQM